MKGVLIEAIVVGIMTVIFGNLAGLLIGPLFKVDLPKVCSDWNKYYTMELTLFATGFLLHLFCEFSGINKWYCTNGIACSR